MKLKNILSSLLVLAALTGGVLPVNAATPYRTHRFYSFKSLPECQEGDILFVGNSITNMMNWWEAFGSRDNIRGRGNSGASSGELLNYFDDIVKGNPAKVFLMIGTNDLGSEGDFNTPDSVAGRIIEFLDRTRKKVPGAEIYYQSILPSLNGKRTKEKTEKTNRLVAEWITAQNDPKTVYVDLYTPMVAEDGNIIKTAPAPDPDALSYDGLHLTQQGYKLWLDIIKPYVGYEPVYGEKAVNLAGGMVTSNGMRVSYFGALPVFSDDILLIGDETIHNGEWQERLNNTNIKDRGIGWGFPGITIATLEGAFDPILSGNAENGVVKETPKAVALYSGTGEVMKGWNADSLFQSYTHALGLLREKLPQTPLFAMTLLPMQKAETEKNQVIKQFNRMLTEYVADPALNISLIDMYEAVGGDNRVEAYFIGEDSPFINGDGYVVLAQAIGNALNGLITLSDYSLLPLPQHISFGTGTVAAGKVVVESPFGVSGHRIY